MPFEGDDADPAADSEAPFDTMPKRGTRPPIHHTIAGLMLDIPTAQKKGAKYLLPGAKAYDYGAGKKYPLPHSQAELRIVSEIRITPKGQSEGEVYVRRARRQLIGKASKAETALGVMANARAVSQVKGEIAAKAEEAKAEMIAAVEGVKVEAVKALATLTDIYNLGFSHAYRVLKSHLTEQPINGKVPTIDQTTDVMKAAFTHVAKMGGVIAPGEVAEAEDLIFRNYVESRKAQLLKDVKGTEH